MKVLQNDDPRYLVYISIHLLAKTKEGPFCGIANMTQRKFLENLGAVPFEDNIKKFYPNYKYGDSLTSSESAELEKLANEYTY